MTASSSVVVFREVSKVFGSVRALDGVSFSVREGSVHALLGHNGAGKTTSIRIALGLLRPTSGSVEVFGRDPYRDPSVRADIGYAGEVEGFYRGLTVRDNLARFCMIRFNDEAFCREEVKRLADLFELHEVLDRKFGKLSAGNRQRVVVARAFMGSPRLLILDEPLNKLDPSWRAKMKKLFRDYADRNRATVLYSTHILPDVEEVSDYVTILRRGRVVFHGTLEQLLAGSTLTAKIMLGRSEDARRIVEEFGGKAEARGSTVTIELSSIDEAHKLLSLLSSSKIGFTLLEVRSKTLEEVYLEYYAEEVGRGGGEKR